MRGRSGTSEREAGRRVTVRRSNEPQRPTGRQGLLPGPGGNAHVGSWGTRRLCSGRFSLPEMGEPAAPRKGGAEQTGRPFRKERVCATRACYALSVGRSAMLEDRKRPKIAGACQRHEATPGAARRRRSERSGRTPGRLMATPRFPAPLFRADAQTRVRFTQCHGPPESGPPSWDNAMLAIQAQTSSGWPAFAGHDKEGMGEPRSAV